MLRSTLVRSTGPLRTLSTSVAARQEVVGTVGAIPRSRPVGGFSILGFLLGFSACSALTIYYLQQDTQTASALLLGSVEELQQGTGKITSHLDRLTAVEKELAALKAASAVKEDVGKLRNEVKKVYDGLHVEVLDLRAHVWGVEQDLTKIVKNESIKI